ncbi:hypothetical protein [Kosmotoga sp. DU53]|uniref:hypothetical protein n=1 Tax=Kosmotoga sp. DU53 TaxID=1310160 RepID=UPI0007C5A6CA|nr:hypothetical protein [Kosmotoga sp. DU53]
MRKLREDLFCRVKENIKKFSRVLEKAIFEKHFEEGNDQRILDELTVYQNYDGGFGKGIESDFRLPYSSPMATSVGVRHLKTIDNLKEARKHIKAAIEYFESSFNAERNGWFAVPREVNLFPHAPWWHFNEKDGMTIIDKNWGNPSAEITAYLYRYREYTKELDVDSLVEYAINHIEEKKEFNSENKVYCYIKLNEELPAKFQKRLEKRIILHP